jgi:hypothetical protein
MAVQELVTRVSRGVGPDGQPVFETTWHGLPKPPETMAEWVEHRVSDLGLAARSRAGRIVVALLQAPGSAERKTVLAEAEDLAEPERYGILKTLEACRQKASDQPVPGAWAFADELYQAWAARFGTQPRPAAAPRGYVSADQ